MECVVLNVKAPEPGKVLVGMQPLLDAMQCAALYQAFLEDTYEFTQELGLKRVFFCSPGVSHPYFQELGKRFYIELVDATGTTHGGRIKAALDAGVQKGGTKVIVWDAETPGYPPKFFKDAFSKLDKADLILGQAMDYGTYLIGARGKATSIFENCKWNSPSELADLVRNAEAAKLNVVLHQVWNRLRRQEDLPFFILNLKQLLKNSPKLARNTQKALASFNLW